MVILQPNDLLAYLKNINLMGSGIQFPLLFLCGFRQNVILINDRFYFKNFQPIEYYEFIECGRLGMLIALLENKSSRDRIAATFPFIQDPLILRMLKREKKKLIRPSESVIIFDDDEINGGEYLNFFVKFRILENGNFELFELNSEPQILFPQTIFYDPVVVFYCIMNSGLLEAAKPLTKHFVSKSANVIEDFTKTNEMNLTTFIRGYLNSVSNQLSDKLITAEELYRYNGSGLILYFLNLPLASKYVYNQIKRIHDGSLNDIEREYALTMKFYIIN